MNPSRLFILRPVATSLLMVGDPAGRHRRLSLPAALGAARGRLPDHPGADLLSRRQPGGDDLLGHRAARGQFGQMPGLNQMSSTSSAGASVITLQFSLDLSLDIAEQEVQAAINAAGNLLPSDLPAPPIYAKVNPADAPILTLALTSKTLPLTQVEDLADTRLAQKISQHARRRPGQHQRRPAAGGAHPGQSARAGRLRAEHRRPAHHARQRQRQHAEGQFRRPGAGLHDQRQRPDRRAPTTTRTWSIAYRTARRCGCRDVATVVRRRRRTPSSAPGPTPRRR